jgi:cell wall-associated NlpC family hydrolase
LRLRHIPPTAILALLALSAPAGFAQSVASVATAAMAADHPTELDGGAVSASGATSTSTSGAASTSSSATPVELDGGAMYVTAATGTSKTAGGAGVSGSGATGGGTAPTPRTGATAPTGATDPTGATTPTRAAGGPTPLGPALTSTVPGTSATILADGYAAAPASAPAAVQEAIWAGNQLIGLPYIYGGGHASFIAAGYDCSGTVSYALHGGDLLAAPLDSTQFMTWGLSGLGTWMTVYANPAHAFLEIAGIRLDTSTAGDPGGLSGPRWRPLLSSTAGFVATHPAGY